MASAVAVLTVALALATVAFAVVDGVLFRALPYERPSELFVLRAENRARVGAERPPVAAQEVEAWVGAVPEIRHGVVDAHLEEFPIDGIPASLARIDERFLEVLGVRPLLGGFTAEDFLGDGDPERGANRPVLLSHRLWRDWTGGDPHVVGRTWLVSQRRGRPYSIRIAGVLGPDFVFPADTGGQPDLLAPLGRLDPLDPRRRFILLFRLEPTVDAARVRARVERATTALASVALPADPQGSN
ncbi:MAG: ABC transporter permease, partial [Phycisphaerales bacterium]